MDYNKQVFIFTRFGDNHLDYHDFIPTETPQKNGVYLTIRIGKGGIYTMLNEWKDGKWTDGCLDMSKTIAISRDNTFEDDFKSVFNEINPSNETKASDETTTDSNTSKI